MSFVDGNLGTWPKEKRLVLKFSTTKKSDLNDVIGTGGIHSIYLSIQCFLFFKVWPLRSVF